MYQCKCGRTYNRSPPFCRKCGSRITDENKIKDGDVLAVRYLKPNQLSEKEKEVIGSDSNKYVKKVIRFVDDDKDEFRIRHIKEND